MLITWDKYVCCYYHHSFWLSVWMLKFQFPIWIMAVCSKSDLQLTREVRTRTLGKWWKGGSLSIISSWFIISLELAKLVPIAWYLITYWYSPGQNSTSGIPSYLLSSPVKTSSVSIKLIRKHTHPSGRVGVVVWASHWEQLKSWVYIWYTGSHPDSLGLPLWINPKSSSLLSGVFWKLDASRANVAQEKNTARQWC